MNIPRFALLALDLFCIGLPCVPSDAFAQAYQWDKTPDLKALVPPIVPLPPDSRLNTGSVGGSQGPNTTVPLQNPSTNLSDPAPGIRLTIPSR